MHKRKLEISSFLRKLEILSFPMIPNLAVYFFGSLNRLPYVSFGPCQPGQSAPSTSSLYDLRDVQPTTDLRQSMSTQDHAINFSFVIFTVIVFTVIVITFSHFYKLFFVSFSSVRFRYEAGCDTQTRRVHEKEGAGPWPRYHFHRAALQCTFQGTSTQC